MTQDTVTNRQLYEAIMRMDEKFDRLMEDHINPLERWKSELTARLAIIYLVGSFAVYFAIDWVKIKLFHQT